MDPKVLLASVPKHLIEYSTQLDLQDPLKQFQCQFEIPPEKVYLCGNSLGPLPKKCRQMMNDELNKWSLQGVEGHFLEPNPWVKIDEINLLSLAKLVGSSSSKEIAVMNSLTVNIHLLLVSFYRPQGRKCKILYEKNAFPSDIYAIKSFLKLKNHDFDYIESSNTEDLIEILQQDQGRTIALVFLGGVNYLTGEVLPMKKISEICEQFSILIGFDLAHAIGNVELQLSKWNVDFACWCSYKYLNSGPGGVAGIFIHEKHWNNSQNKFQRLEGWWGNSKQNRFQMFNTFVPDDFGASAWQLSNPPVFQCIALRASLDIFDEISDLKQMFEKSRKLTLFLEQCLHELLPQKSWELLTPPYPARGCQLSIVFLNGRNIDEIFEKMSKLGFICDKREPNILRVAPAPLFNTFRDVLLFAAGLKRVLSWEPNENSSSRL
jgi:kynureninase